MGYYIEDTRTVSKEDFLLYYGRQIAAPTLEDGRDYTTGPVVVCLVDNGLFTAAGICYSQQEMQQFLPTWDDQRPRYWFELDRTRAAQRCPDFPGAQPSPPPGEDA